MESKTQIQKMSFEEYDQQHPHIWRAFRDYAYRAMERGFKRYSAKALFEIIRWQTAIEKGKDGFKVNNNFTADYARKLIQHDQTFESFFSLRKRNK